MLRKKTNESLVDYGWRLNDAYREESYKLSKMVDSLMTKNGDKETSIPDSHSSIETMDGLKWFKITNIRTTGLVDTKEYAIILVDFNIYDSPEDAEKDIIEKEVIMREFSDIPRRMQLFILRKLDLIYNNN